MCGEKLKMAFFPLLTERGKKSQLKTCMWEKEREKRPENVVFPVSASANVAEVNTSADDRAHIA